MRTDEILIKPVLTEKSNYQREMGKYSFVINSRANKIQVIKAIKTQYGVQPQNCRIVNVKPKPRRQRYVLGKTSGWKKAIITLAKGETISVFEGV